MYTKMETLWVRACKAENPQVRLRSVYRRFYFKQPSNVTEAAIVIILSGIVEGKHLPFRLLEFINKLDSNSWQNKLCNHEADFNQLAINALVDVIRYLHKDKFGSDFHWPKKWRN